MVFVTNLKLLVAMMSQRVTTTTMQRTMMDLVSSQKKATIAKVSAWPMPMAMASVISLRHSVAQMKQRATSTRKRQTTMTRALNSMNAKFAPVTTQLAWIALVFPTDWLRQMTAAFVAATTRLARIVRVFPMELRL